MSIADTALAYGFSNHLTAVHGDRFQVMNGKAQGSWFSAVHEKAETLELTTEVTKSDPREMIVLHVARGDVPLGLEKGNIFAGIGSKFELLRREDNPSDQTVDFWAQKLVPGKDK